MSQSENFLEMPQALQKNGEDPDQGLLHQNPREQMIEYVQIGGLDNENYDGFGRYHNFNENNQNENNQLQNSQNFSYKNQDQRSNNPYSAQNKLLAQSQMYKRMVENNIISHEYIGNLSNINQRQQLKNTPLKRKCICKKTQCLKMYCECFASNSPCNEQCICLNCKNTQEHQQQIINAKQMIRQKGIVGLHSCSLSQKRCNCKKSNCLKKYCECFNSGVKCSEGCKCNGCKNCDNPKQEQEQVVDKKKKTKNTKKTVEKQV